MPVHHWKSKSTDVLITLVILVIFMAGVHVMLSLNNGRHAHHESLSFQQRLVDPTRICMSVIGTLLAFSPIYIFRRKVPKEMILDTDNNLLIINRRTGRKQQSIALQGASYNYYSLTFFSVFEIYHDFETRRGIVRRRYLTVLIPKTGMSLTDRHLRELIKLLKEEGLELERNVVKRTLNELMTE